VNDGEQNINDVIAHNFERQNFITWLAVNVLTGNFDTVTQNFFLYGPPGCQGWYFLPWDYDGALEFYQQRGEASLPRYRAGLANWWSVRLIRRFLEDPRNLRDLDQRITELSQDAMGDAALHERASSYYGVVGPFVTRLPDLNYLPTHGVAAAADRIAQWEDEYARLDGVIARRVAEYRYTLARPMPVLLYLPVPGASPRDAYAFTWSRSYLLHGGDFSYDFEVSRTYAFAPADLVIQERGLRQAIAMVTLAPGTYYWRVVVRSDNQPGENWMTPFGSGYAKLQVDARHLIR
jgi:spore coat protein H